MTGNGNIHSRQCFLPTPSFTGVLDFPGRPNIFENEGHPPPTPEGGELVENVCTTQVEVVPTRRSQRLAAKDLKWSKCMSGFGFIFAFFGYNNPKLCQLQNNEALGRLCCISISLAGDTHKNDAFASPSVRRYVRFGASQPAKGHCRVCFWRMTAHRG